jgi:glycosyltransferase involved in cell wall biosynthesis
MDSRLLTTRSPDFSEEWKGVEQFARKGPGKAYFAPGLRVAARSQIDNVSVFHGHGLYVYPNYLLGRLARAQGKPLVYHPHGFFDPWILARSKMKKRIAHFLFETSNIKHVSWWRALSSKETDQIRAVGVTAPIEIIPNGVHMPAKRTAAEIKEIAERYPRKRQKRIVFLSRVHPKKGLDLLFHAWAKLDPDLTKDWEIAVFGPDEGGHLAELQSEIQLLGIEDSVTFYGSVSGTDKEAAYRSGDLFVLPSRSEGFPMAVLEAASYGLPVLQTTECNFPELTAAGGAWEAQPAVDSIEQSLIEALNADDTERSQRGAAGKALVQCHYQWSAIAQQVDETCKRYC